MPAIDGHPDTKLLITEAGDGSITVAIRDVFIAREIGAVDSATSGR